MSPQLPPATAPAQAPETCLPDNGVAAAAGPHPTGSPIPPHVAWLFRRTLARGRLHPLMPLVMHYRQSQGGEGPT